MECLTLSWSPVSFIKYFEPILVCNMQHMAQLKHLLHFRTTDTKYSALQNTERTFTAVYNIMLKIN